MNIAITTSEKVLAAMDDASQWYSTSAICAKLGIERGMYRLSQNISDILYHLEKRGAIVSRRFGRRKLYRRVQ